MKKFFAEFKKFITRGNIVDMSVGVIVGGAFTAIVNGLSNNILKPIINWFLAILLGKDSLSDIYTYLQKVEVPELDANGAETGKMVVDLAQSIYIDWGAFINAIINFLIIAFVLFTIVKIINRVNETNKKLSDMKTKIAFKQEKGIKLNKKEKKFLEAEEKRIEEEKAKAEAEANKIPEPTTNDLLKEILAELKK